MGLTPDRRKPTVRDTLLDRVHQIATDPGAGRQRELIRQHGAASLSDLLDDALREIVADPPMAGLTGCSWNGRPLLA